MIPLTAGPKFIRLHFHLTSYPGFDLSKAFFSVKAGPFTLLTNFSALLHAQGKPTLVKEFSVVVEEGQSLNITFTLSSAMSDAYAFINGIEIVSMPTNLYYGSPANENGIPFFGIGTGALQYSLGNSTALETMHGINTGGADIPPANDTGMYRAWSSDDNYLAIAESSVIPVNTSINLNFSNQPPFVAPDVIYRKARTMGTNRTINENYYLTWEFSVDSGFNYLVRLHFCEFQIEITRQGDRVFEILLANLTAETLADVIAWSGGRGFPIYRDYVVAIGNKGNLKQQNLSIALHPAPAWRTLYSDGILNGLEIFKLSNNLNIAGPNPDPISNLLEDMKPPKHDSPIRQPRKKRTILAMVAGLTSSFIVISLLFFLVYRIFSTKIVKNNSAAPALPSDVCRLFSLKEIKAATKNFDQNFIIGKGGFGNVYKGFINDGSTLVAIKRLNPSSNQGLLEFKTEIEMLSQLRHQNLVSLIGYCEDGKEMILVYDYMVHGTLRDHLYNTNNPPLPWNQRLKLCIGAAHGLNYLHRGPNHTIIHRDVKTANILLSEKWTAKVSDFGLSKMNDMSNTHISTAVKGSFGYLDPEYYRLHQLSEKSDVYSFGVVLFEVLCARAPIDRTRDHMQISLAEWAKHCYDNGTLDQIIDPYLQGKISTLSLLKFGEVAYKLLCFRGG
ncbi:hypothetical protein CCACVL1_01987 [Corchorus capsularis]|uniref:Protein kinase domain-containing protein n=1 Tax=Corchorus capsularis TaxID=210143 RepID=A0A1R3KDZ7_COCAP|nr:hypothetical protein CCACVL1_01987 [Corchorus capsularis]